MSNEYIKMIEQRLIEMREKKGLSPAQKKHLDKDKDGDIDGKDFDILRKKKDESSDKMTPCPKCDGSVDNHDPECPDHPDNKGKSDAEEGCGNYDKKMKKEEVDQVEEKLERDGPAKPSQAKLDKKFCAHVRATMNDKGKTSAYLNKKRDQKDAQMKKNDPGQQKSMPNYTSNFIDKGKAVKNATKRGLRPTPYDTMSGVKPNKMQKLQRGMKESTDLDENFRTLATKGMGAETKKTINVGRDVDYFEPKNGDKRQGRVTKIHATGYHVKDEKDGKTHSFTFHDRAKAKKMLESNQPVISAQWGFGEVIESTEKGLIVYFEHGVEFNIPAEDLTFVGEAADRAKHYKGATKPETMLDKYKGAGAKKMATDNNVESPKEADITPEEKGHEDATKAGRAVSKQSPTRRGEPRKGDISIVNPVKGAVTKTTGRE